MIVENKTPPMTTSAGGDNGMLARGRDPSETGFKQFVESDEPAESIGFDADLRGSDDADAKDNPVFNPPGVFSEVSAQRTEFAFGRVVATPGHTKSIEDTGFPDSKTGWESAAKGEPKSAHDPGDQPRVPTDNVKIDATVVGEHSKNSGGSKDSAEKSETITGAPAQSAPANQSPASLAQVVSVAPVKLSPPASRSSAQAETRAASVSGKIPDQKGDGIRKAKTSVLPAPAGAKGALLKLTETAILDGGLHNLPDAKPTPLDEQSWGVLSTGVQSNVSELAPNTDLRIVPQRSIQLIAQAAVALQDRPIELTLNPQELGRVRLTLQFTDGGMAVSITVERPETLDLLRRNIDQLANQLRDIGYEDLSFSFTGQGEEFSDDSQENQNAPQSGNELTALETNTPDPMRIEITPESGIDIRL